MKIEKTALLLIDLQNEYRSLSKWTITGYETVLANAARLIDSARASGVPVIHAQAWVEQEQREAYRLQNEGLAEEFRSAVAGGEGAEICAEVAPQPGDIVIRKRWASAFRDTELKRTLEARGIENLVVGGVLTDSCVAQTTIDAVYGGYRVWLVKEACGSMSDSMHRVGVLEIANRLYGGGVVRLAEAINALSGKPFTCWQCSRPMEFVFTMETADSLYELL